MADTASHSGHDPGRISFVKALRLCRRSLTQGSFSPEDKSATVVWQRGLGWAGQPPQSGPPTAPESEGDQTQNVEVASQETTPPTAQRATTGTPDYRSTNLMVLGLRLTGSSTCGSSASSAVIRRYPYVWSQNSKWYRIRAIRASSASRLAARADRD